MAKTKSAAALMMMIFCIVNLSDCSVNSKVYRRNGLSPIFRLRGGSEVIPSVMTSLEVPLSCVEIEHVEEGEMSMKTAIFNLVTDLCAHGMLPLAYGIASNSGTGILTAIFIVLAFGLTSCYTIVSLGRASQITGQYSFKGLWGSLLSRNTAWIIELSFAVMTFGCCIFYSAFIGDLFASIFSAISFVPESIRKRWIILTSLTLFPLLPLCLLKNLSALQLTSFGGLLSVLYTAFFVVKRSLDGTYSPGGKYFDGIEEKFRNTQGNPWARVGLWGVGSGTVTLMNMAAVAFMAHYNGIKYYEELENRSVERYAKAMGTGMACSFLVFIVLMLFGFRTFGGATQTLILNNYHQSEDRMAMVARLTTGLAIICGYPIMFTALKSSSLNTLSEIGNKFKQVKIFSNELEQSENLRTFWYIFLLSIITAMACDKGEEEVAVVVGLIGALLGSGANFIIPALLNLRLFELTGKSRKFFSERSFNKSLVAIGAVFMVIGTSSVLNDSHH